MFKKLLIANRGEIACRILRTAHRMGIPCVAVYSDADQNALHVELADEAVHIGPPPPQESYLNSDAILAAARETNADAIHPGYGFLSENAEFARKVKETGITLVGPSPEAMELMGDKIKAKGIARSAGVSVIPGLDEAISETDQAQAIADDIGYPVMLKAAAGGGGKGMRIVESSKELPSAFERVKSEALTGFGDDRIFVEKFIPNPRHIEFQILADTHGNIIHLGERECSLQRRHQKVIEEAPSPFMTPELRQKMAKQAVSLAQAVNYTSAGTVEFIVDEDHNFYFLEMNTRLQVEHPVTEFITGLDLVEEMIRIAAGERLRHKQSDISFKGHAIETRIYAEDSTRGFLPSTGRLVYFIRPSLGETLRLDTGVQEGDTITPYYDPMIGKLIAYGPDRESARLQLATHLDQLYIRGIETNSLFASHLLNSDDFRTASISTCTLDKLYGDGYKPTVSASPQTPVSAAALIYCLQQPLDFDTPQVVLLDRTPHDVTVSKDRDIYRVSGDGWQEMIESKWRPGQPIFSGVFNGHEINFQVDASLSGTLLSWEGNQAMTRTLNPRVAELFLKLPEKAKLERSNTILSPMPGLIVDIQVNQGDQVKAGQPVAVIEAMKMENIIQAPRDGVVDEVLVEKCQSVAVDQTLMVLGE